MSKEKLETVNEVVATGRMIWNGRNERGYPSFRLAVRDGFSDKPSVIYFTLGENLMLDPSIRYNSYIHVKGYVKAFYYLNDMRQKYTAYQEFVATEVEKADSELHMRFGTEGRYVADSLCRIYVLGEVYSVAKPKEDNNHWGRITIKVNGTGRDRRPSTIPFNYYMGFYLPELNFKKGDVVCLCASVKVRDKEVDGSNVHFENLVVEDIAKIE